MRQLTYLAVLAACLLGTLPLELVLRVRVYTRWRRLLGALAPGLVLGVAWDLYAVRHGQWHFDHDYLIGLNLAGLPVEEVLFFVVIPVCAILTLEAVVRHRPGWPIGDEPAEPSKASEPSQPSRPAERAAGELDRPAR